MSFYVHSHDKACIIKVILLYLEIAISNYFIYALVIRLYYVHLAHNYCCYFMCRLVLLYA